MLIPKDDSEGWGEAHRSAMMELRWVLARTRERPGYAKLTERARELDRLKAEF